MTGVESEEEREQGRPHRTPRRYILGFERRAIVRVAVCIGTVWMIVLLMSLLVVVGLYTSQANQLFVVSSVAVISTALVVASCKLNSIAGLSKMLAEEVAAKEDPPPKYDDVLHSDPPPPSYFAVVSEAAGASGGASSSRSNASSNSSSRPGKSTGTAGKDAAVTNSQDNASKQSASSRSSPAFRRWLGRSSFLQSVMFRGSRTSSATGSPAQATKEEGKGRTLRRSSSTPSLACLTGPIPLPLARCPSTPSICDPCGCF